MIVRKGEGRSEPVLSNPTEPPEVGGISFYTS